MSGLLDKMKTYINMGIDISKDAVSIAGNAVQTMGENSVLRIEIKKFESQVDNEFKLLGLRVYKVLKDEDAASVSKFDDQIAESLEKIKKMQAEIEHRLALLKAKDTKAEI